MDLCYWQQPGRTRQQQISSWINLIMPTQFFEASPRKMSGGGCTCFCGVDMLHFSPACQAGPGRFTCVTEWGWDGEAGDSGLCFYFIFHTFILSVMCCCWVTWWQIFLKPHDSPGKDTNLCTVSDLDHSAFALFLFGDFFYPSIIIFLLHHPASY